LLQAIEDSLTTVTDLMLDLKIDSPLPVRRASVNYSKEIILREDGNTLGGAP